MKKIKKFFTAIIIATCLSLIFGASALASDGEAAVGKNVFESAFSLVTENADELFSALAFIGTMIIAFFYKRGLTPTLSRGIEKISATVGEARRASDESSELFSKLSEKISDRLAYLESSLEGFSLEIMKLEDILGTQAEFRSDRESIKMILASQIDMLSDIFMTSALPQYQKDAVGERVKAMREALSENEETSV